MQKQICFTVNEIHKLKLLNSGSGQPIKALSHVQKIVNRLSTGMIQTKWGLAKTLTQEQIDNYNNNLKQLANREYIPTKELQQ